MGSARRRRDTGLWTASWLLLLLAAVAQAQVTPFEAILVSEVGDYIGGGANYHFVASTSSDVVQPVPTDNSTDLRWTRDGLWRFVFAGANNTRLQPGSYENAERWPFAEPGHPNLSISGRGNGCNRLVGRFDVWEVSYAADGRVQSLAVDAAQYCESSTRALRVYLRYGSTTVPLMVPRTAARAGTDQLLLPGALVTLNGAQSTAQDGGSLAYSWTQVGGPPIALTGRNTATPSFIAPALTSAEWHALQWQLEVQDTQGRRATDRLTVMVSANTTPRSEIRIDSHPNDGLRQGRDVQQMIDPAHLTLDRNYDGGIALRYAFQAPEQGELQLQLAGPGRQEVGIGHYKLAYRYPFSVASGKSGLDVVLGLGCGQSLGRFVVHDVAYGANGQVERLAVDFQQSCTYRNRGETPVLGYIRVNSVVPITSRAPTANGGIDLIVEPGDGVRLNGTRSQGGASPVASYSWTQLSGPAVQLTGAGSSAPQFLAPVAPSGGVDLQFRLTVTNGAGYSSADVANVHVLGVDERRSYAYLEPTGYDFATSGETLWLDENTGAFSINQYVLGVRENVTVTFNDITRSTLTLMAPEGQSLVRGIYPDANTSDRTKAGAAHASDGRGCNQSLGTLIIHEIERDSNGDVISLAADFTYTCDYQALTYVVVRFNSTVPFVAPTLIASAGANQRGSGGDVVQLDARTTHRGAGNITGYSWRQVSGPAVTLTSQNRERVSFTAPDAGGVLEFEVTVATSDGQTSTSTVRIDLDPVGTRRSLVVLEPDPNEPLTVGVPLRWHMPVNEPQSWSNDPNFVRVTVFQHDITLQLWALGQQPLTAGTTYEGARIFGALGRQSLNFPGLDFTMNHAGCAVPRGRFTVRELVRNSAGALTSLAVDIQQVCDPGSSFVRGAFRFNSNVPVGSSTPLASAGPDLTVLAGDSILLDGRASTGHLAGNTTYRWQQVSGPTVTFSGTSANTAQAIANAPQVAGVQDAVFSLTVTNSLGLSATDQVTVRILGAGEPTSSAIFARYDPVTRLVSDEWIFNTNNSTPSVSGDTQTLAVRFSAPLGFAASFPLQTPTTKLVPGVYAVGTGGSLRFEFRGDDNAVCVQTRGVVHIHSAVYDGDTLHSIAFDFDIACPAGWAYAGAVRFNAPERVEFGRTYAEAGSVADVNEGATVTLNGTRSLIVAVPIETYTWTQTAGPTVTLTPGATGVVTFVAPQVSAATTLQFRVDISGRSGQYVAGDTVSVNVLDTTPLPGGGTGGSGGAPRGGGGGGGSLDALTALLMLTLLCATGIRGHRRRHR